MKVYENSGVPTFGGIPPEEDKTVAAQEYGEGFEPLINFLKTAWEHNMQTFACCSGHEYENYSSAAYVSFIVEDEKLFSYIIAKISNTGLLRNIWLQADAYLEKGKGTQIKGKTEINFYCKFKDREKFFNEFSNIIKQYDKEKDNTFEELSASKIMKIFMNRTSDSGMQIGYNPNERKMYEMIYKDENGKEMELCYTQEEADRVLCEQVIGRTRPKSKVIDALREMCEMAKNIEEIGTTKLNWVKLKMENALIEAQAKENQLYNEKGKNGDMQM